MEKKMLRFDVKVDIYSNGVAVIIKDKKQKNKMIGNKLFIGKGYQRKEADWIDRIVKKAEKMNVRNERK